MINQSARRDLLCALLPADRESPYFDRADPNTAACYLELPGLEPPKKSGAA
jgi:hypothetical protein